MSKSLMKRSLPLLRLALPLWIVAVCSAQTPCERLKSLSLPNTTISAAELVAAGPFHAPDQAEGPPVMLPAHCRVAAVLAPSSDSNIEMEMWLPADWNGKFEAVGNGGWAGNIEYIRPNAVGARRAEALKEGYATASTDTGHKAAETPGASFSLGHPEKLIDFAYRAVHEMTVQSKAIITAFYGRGPRLSYWNGCSTGGRQGLMEVQRYPEDFDAVLAGAPANYQMHLNAWDLNWALTNQKDKDHLVPPSKLNVLNQAVLAACDALDGVRDGLLTDPRKCHFDPASLLCSAGDGPNCLTKAQLESVRAAYAPARTKAGKLIYPGLPFGGEAGLTRMSTDQPFEIAMSAFRYVAHQDPNWDWRAFDLDQDVTLIDEKAGFINAVNPDLSAFKAHGGKLIQYHGWSDQLISPENSVNYHASVLSKMGAKQDDWYRLFMLPGMMHCGGGPGPNQFSGMAALERWRESDIAPDQITAYHVENNRVTMTRPLCPYPQVPAYKSSGSTNDAANFVCKLP